MNSRTDDPWSGITTMTDHLVGRRIAHAHPLDVYWVRDMDGKPGVVFRGIDSLRIPYQLPRPRGVSLQIGTHAETSELKMYLRQSGHLDVFRTLCMDVVGFSAESPSRSVATERLFRRLGHWHELMSRARTTVMSAREIRGLVAELHVLERLIERRGLEAGLGFWIAPDDAPKDFATETGLIEVKARLSGSRPRVTISSLEQLEPAGIGLSLLVVQLTRSEAPQACSLNELCGRLLAIAVADSPAVEDQLQLALLKRGYTRMDEYGVDRYVASAFEAFEVRDGFPRLTRSGVDARIPEARYQLDTAQLSEFAIEVSEVI